MIERFWVHDVTIARAAVTADRYGDARPDWADAARTAVRGWLAREATTEVRDGREEVISDYILSLPPGTDVVATDRIEARGGVYEVVGDVEEAPTPVGTHHLILRLRTFRG
jgi:head-tail adaptor